MPPDALISGSALDRYARQRVLPQIGDAGQHRLTEARVVLFGCGALGTHIADLLTRAGVGCLRIVDRDFVELHNLQRQALFTTADAHAGVPKALAAAEQLRAINPDITIEPIVADVQADNIERLAEGCSVLLDGSDNFDLRFLLNDLAVASQRPWVYAACIGWEGRVMPIVPGDSACLRCVFADPPEPGTTPTCDTAGVLGPAAGVVASWAAAETIKLIATHTPHRLPGLLAVDLWTGRIQRVTTSRSTDCPCCGRRQFAWLNSPTPRQPVALCGRDAVQVSPGASATPFDLFALATRLAGNPASATPASATPAGASPAGATPAGATPAGATPAGATPAGASPDSAGVALRHRSPYLVRFSFRRRDRELTASVFADGRAIIQGTTDFAEARAVYSQYIGM